MNKHNHMWICMHLTGIHIRICEYTYSHANMHASHANSHTHVWKCIHQCEDIYSYVNKSCHICEWVMSRTCMSRGTHTTGYMCDITIHMCDICVKSQLPGAATWRIYHTYECGRLTTGYVCDIISHIWMRQVAATWSWQVKGAYSLYTRTTPHTATHTTPHTATHTATHYTTQCNTHYYTAAHTGIKYILHLTFQAEATSDTLGETTRDIRNEATVTF